MTFGSVTTHKGDNYLLYYHRYHNRNKIIGNNGSVYGSIIKLFNCCGRYSKYWTLMRLIKYSVFAQRNSQVILFKFVVNRTFIVTVPNASDWYEGHAKCNVFNTNMHKMTLSQSQTYKSDDKLPLKHFVVRSLSCRLAIEIAINLFIKVFLHFANLLYCWSWLQKE